MQGKATTKNTEDTENRGFWGNSSRSYALEPRDELTLKKSDRDCSTDGAGGYSVFFVSSVVTSS